MKYLNFKKSWNLLKKNANPILAVLTLVLIILTVFSIVSTYYVANVSLYVQQEARRQEIKDTIDLIDGLVIELMDDKNKLAILINGGENLKNDTSAWQFNLLTNKLEQAKERNLGNNEIRIQINGYLNGIYLINSHLEEIREASSYKDSLVRLERINGAIKDSKILYEGDSQILKIDSFVDKILKYRNEKQKEYDFLSEKTLEKLKER